jgi:hypothetical protein
MIRDVFESAKHTAELREVTYDIWEQLKLFKLSVDLVSNLAEASVRLSHFR